MCGTYEGGSCPILAILQRGAGAIIGSKHQTAPVVLPVDTFFRAIGASRSPDGHGMLRRVSARARAAAPDPPDPDDVREVHDADHAGERRTAPSLTDVAFTGCSFATADARRATLTRVAATGCRLTGLTLTAAALRDVRVGDCQADLTGFDGATLDRVRFEQCALREASFVEARLHSVAFVDCDLSGADFSGAEVSRVELLGCRLDRVRGLASLRGAQLRWTDVLDSAGVFAAALGFVVLEED